jgi:hypothetical protein
VFPRRLFNQKGLTMSFNFAAVGKRDDVRSQLAHLDLTYGGELGEATRQFAIDAVSATHVESPDYDRYFVVKASGHADAMGLALSLTIETIHALKAVDQSDSAVGELEQPLHAAEG